MLGSEGLQQIQVFRKIESVAGYAQQNSTTDVATGLEQVLRVIDALGGSLKLTGLETLQVLAPVKEGRHGA